MSATTFSYTREWTDAEAFPLLSFTRNWENPEDYPTVETDEQVVRRDMQSLHDEVKDFLNNELIPRVVAEDATLEVWAAQETAHAEAETARVEAEAARVAAETARTEAETARADAESARVGVEAVRVEAEAARAEAEAARADVESARVEAETARAEAETARAEAESSRVEAETARADAESTRAETETARIEAETARGDAESARAVAEAARVAAETARAEAEDARNVWEDYSATANYVPGNKVAYEGASYLNISACTGIAPPDEEHWLLIADQGTAIESIVRTSGNGAAGTTDIYTITMTDGRTYTFPVYHGADGEGAGDMQAVIYDPQGKRTDIYAYVEEHGGEQSDWNENDETAKSYVKNRFGGYCEMSWVEDKAPATFTFTDQGEYYRVIATEQELLPSISVGPNQAVRTMYTIDGVEYPGTFTFKTSPLYEFNSDDGLVYMSYSPLETSLSLKFYGDIEDGGHEIAVYVMSEVPVPIDEKFLPDTVATKQYVATAVAASGGFVVQDSAPDKTTLLWIDTAVGGVLKYHNGTAWVAIASTWQ